MTNFIAVKILKELFLINHCPAVRSVHIGKMAAATLSFRWLEILEKEFDKAFVDLDLLLGEIDPDQCEITYEGRQKMTALSASFAQLCHKAQTVFQSNAKLEVRLVCKHLVCGISYAAVMGVILILSVATPQSL